MRGSEKMKVIVNADDFGYSKGQNLGVLECFQEGIVSSTSLMVNMPGFDHAIELMRQYSCLKVGLHFVMTVGKPLSDARGLTNEDGYFDHDLERIEKAEIQEIEKEYRAQLNKFMQSGFKPTHLDYHYGCTNKQYEIIMKLAKELNIPIRAIDRDVEEKARLKQVKSSRNFMNQFYDDGVSLDNLLQIFENNKDKDLIEIMCHPAYVDATILKNSSYHIKRAFEKEILTSEKVKEFLKEHEDIQLISYQEL